MKRRLKINGFIIFLAFLLIVIFPDIFLRPKDDTLMNGIAMMGAITLIVLGQIIRASARGYKAEHSQNSQRLIRSGPYSVVRNPMYIGILSVGLGLTIALFRWWVLLVFLVIFIVRYILLIFKEEKKLLAAFPQEYGDYRKEVNRIFPSINKIAKMKVAEYLPLRLSWLKKELGPLLAVLFVTLCFDAWSYIKTGSLISYTKRLLLVFLVLAALSSLAAYLIKRTERG